MSSRPRPARPLLTPDARGERHWAFLLTVRPALPAKTPPIRRLVREAQDPVEMDHGLESGRRPSSAMEGAGRFQVRADQKVDRYPKLSGTAFRYISATQSPYPL